MLNPGRAAACRLRHRLLQVGALHLIKNEKDAMSVEYAYPVSTGLLLFTYQIKQKTTSMTISSAKVPSEFDREESVD